MRPWRPSNARRRVKRDVITHDASLLMDRRSRAIKRHQLDTAPASTAKQGSTKASTSRRPAARKPAKQRSTAAATAADAAAAACGATAKSPEAGTFTQRHCRCIQGLRQKQEL